VSIVVACQFSVLAAPAFATFDYSRALIAALNESSLGQAERWQGQQAADPSRITVEVIFADSAVQQLEALFKQIAQIASAVLWQQAPGETISCIYGLVTRLEAGKTLPGWVLGEFSNRIVIDEASYKLMSVQRRSGWLELKLQGPRLFSRPIEAPQHDEVASDSAVVEVHCTSEEELVDLAERAYAGVAPTEQLGGRALFVSFCLDWNRQREGGKARLPSAAAIGLRNVLSEGNIADRLSSGALVVLRAVGISKMGPP
jgi:hypothetical protein